MPDKFREEAAADNRRNLSFRLVEFRNRLIEQIFGRHGELARFAQMPSDSSAQLCISRGIGLRGRAHCTEKKVRFHPLSPLEAAGRKKCVFWSISVRRSRVGCAAWHGLQRETQKAIARVYSPSA